LLYVAGGTSRGSLRWCAKEGGEVGSGMTFGEGSLLSMAEARELLEQAAEDQAVRDKGEEKTNANDADIAAHGDGG